MSPVGRLVFKTSEVRKPCLVGSTPTSSANQQGSDAMPLLFQTAGYDEQLDLTQERALLVHYQAKRAKRWVCLRPVPPTPQPLRC